MSEPYPFIAGRGSIVFDAPSGMASHDKTIGTIVESPCGDRYVIVKVWQESGQVKMRADPVSEMSTKGLAIASRCPAIPVTPVPAASPTGRSA